MQDKLCEIINHNGIDKQIIVWIEEMSELTKELCKYLREKSCMICIKEEITDVQVCLDQMKLAFKYTAQDQKRNYDYKVERELEREKHIERKMTYK